MPTLIDRFKAPLADHLAEMFAKRHLGSETDACYVVVDTGDAYIQILAPPEDEEPLLLEAASTDYVPQLASILTEARVRQLEAYGFHKIGDGTRANYHRDLMINDIDDIGQIAEFMLTVLVECYNIPPEAELRFIVNDNIMGTDGYNDPASADEDSTDDTQDYDSRETGFQGYGNHWEAVFGPPEQSLGKVIPTCLEKGQLIPGCPLPAERGGTNRSDTHCGLEAPDTPLRIISVVKVMPKENSSTLVTAYPAAVDGIVHRLLITKIAEWTSKVEAVIHAEFPEGPALCFFDPYYFRNKYIWKEGEYFDVSLSGIASNLEISETKDITLTNPDTIRILNNVKKEAGYENPEEEGKEIKISTKGMTCFFPIEQYPDEAQIRGPVKSVGFFSIMDYDVACYRCTILRLDSDSSDDVDINIYASKRVADFNITPGTDIEGIVWLNGTLPFDLNS